MISTAELGLDAVGTLLRIAVANPTKTQHRLLAQLEEQTKRLRQSAFQLAILGQFKRGKSSLLNALVGEPVLSAGVLPLTAVPTFLKGSPVRRLTLTLDSGLVEERQVDTIELMAQEIAAATTEDGNPHNRKGLRRVDVGIPGAAWLDDVTLIDTPGIGSTHIHNTEAAYAVLPECDAALFICSVDPPITEVELEYLSHIRRTVPRIIVVLNKADLVDAADLDRATTFLETIIADRTGVEIDRQVFAVSARQALEARRTNDTAMFDTSGLAELERYVRTVMIDRKRDLLELSITNKMTEIAAALAGDATMTARALSLPLDRLDATVSAFEEAAIAFERERVNLDDGLNGEWRRALTRLDSLCTDVEARTRHQLNDQLQGASGHPDEGRSAAARVMNDVLGSEFATLTATVETELTNSIKNHQQRYQMLASRVRESAGALLNVSLAGTLPMEWFETKREAYLVAEKRVESLSSITADHFSRLLPEAVRRRRQEKKFREAVNRALTRNISDLHWTMKQNIDDSFRVFIAASRGVVETSISSTRELLAKARQRQHEQGISIRNELDLAEAAERRLSNLYAALKQRQAGLLSPH